MILAIVQARMNSTRLPGKVLKPILDRPMLHYHVSRLARAQRINRVVVATTERSDDDAVANYCRDELDVPCLRGSTDNVLQRYEMAARAFPETRHVIRTTADCPLIDPALVDRVVDHYLARQPGLDYLRLDVEKFPRGLDIEVFKRTALAAAYRNARTAEEKEHVTPYIYRTSGRFRTDRHSRPAPLAPVRLCVDTKEDFEMVRRILEALMPALPDFTWTDVMDWLDANPNVKAINAGVEQKTLPPKSTTYAR